MANPDRPRGFRPAKSYSGAGVWSGRVVRIQAADRSSATTNNHGDIYIGDPVALSSGKVIVANSNASIFGVCVGIGSSAGLNFGDTPYTYFQANDLSQSYGDLAETTEVWVAVVPAEGVLFEVQSATDLDLAVGSACDISIAAGATHGSRVSGQSIAEVITSTNSDCTVMEIVDAVDNDRTLANTRYLVKFNDRV